MYSQWANIPLQSLNRQYHILTANLEPIIDTISSVVSLNGQQNAFWKSRPVDISQWEQWACIVTISWSNKRNFSFCVNMAEFRSDGHIHSYMIILHLSNTVLINFRPNVYIKQNPSKHCTTKRWFQQPSRPWDKITNLLYI